MTLVHSNIESNTEEAKVKDLPTREQMLEKLKQDIELAGLQHKLAKHRAMNKIFMMQELEAAVGMARYKQQQDDLAKEATKKTTKK
jgi:hypothetical protein